MGRADIHGDARVDPRNPRAFAVCDEGGEWVNRRDLHKQMEWSGTTLVWNGSLVCARHLTKPNEQLRTIKLPPDPLPVHNPRPEIFATANQPLGFTPYAMWAGGLPLNFGVVLEDGSGNPILTGTGQQILLEIGADGPALLAQLQQMTGIAVPADIQSYNSTIAVASVAQALVPASATRTYIAIFNPCTAPLAVSLGTAQMGISPGSVNIGAGGCLFWATAQGGAAPNLGAMTVVGNIAGVPYYAYSN